MPPPTLASWLACVDALAFFLLGAVHVFWASGGKWGAAVAFPERWRTPECDVKERSLLRMRPPTPRATLAVAFALFAASAVMLGRVGWLPFFPWRPAWIFPQWLFTAGTWLLALLFVGRAVGDFRTIGFFKARRQGRFAWWDTRLFSPLCLIVGLVAAAVAVTAP